MARNRMNGAHAESRGAFFDHHPPRATPPRKRTPSCVNPVAHAARRRGRSRRAARARPSWDEYFMKLAMLASERATCPRMHCGCVLVKDRRCSPRATMDRMPATALRRRRLLDRGRPNAFARCTRDQRPLPGHALWRASDGLTAYVTNMPARNAPRRLLPRGFCPWLFFRITTSTGGIDFPGLRH
jgi:hypothetical protein